MSDLGVLIDNNLNWKQHINLINEKKTFGIIARLRHFLADYL